MKDEGVEICRGIDDARVIHTYPYSSLPVLESHVHPKFVVFNAGMKMRKLVLEGKSAVLKKPFEDYPSLTKIQYLYRNWIQELPKFALKDKTYVDPELELVYDCEFDDDIGDGNGDDPHDNDSDYDEPMRTRTTLGRGDGFYLRRRTRSVVQAEQARSNEDNGFDDQARPRTRSVAAEQAGNGDVNGARGGKTRKTRTSKVPVKKRKVLSESFTHNQQLLSEATLSRINQQFGEAAWTADRIRQWSNFRKKRRVVPSYPFL